MIVEGDSHITTGMRRVLKMMKREDGPMVESKPDLELNPDHPMMAKLDKLRHVEMALAQEIAEQVFDHALLAAGLMEDPRAMLTRGNRLLEKLLG